jgi:hypothetical protein
MKVISYVLFLLLVCSIVCINNSVVVHADTTTGLILYQPFNGTFADYSGAGITTPSGGTGSFTPNCINGNTCLAPSSDLSDAISSNIGSWTLSGWWNPVSDDFLQNLWEFNPPAIADNSMYIYQADDNWQWYDAETTASFVAFTLAPNDSIFLSVTCDNTSNNVTFYMNGTETSSYNIPGQCYTMFAPTLHMFQQGANFLYFGNIAQMSLYNRTLSPSDISDLFNQNGNPFPILPPATLNYSNGAINTSNACEFVNLSYLWIDSPNLLSDYICSIDYGDGTFINSTVQQFPMVAQAYSQCIFMNNCTGGSVENAIVYANGTGGEFNSTTVFTITVVTTTTTTTTTTSTTTTVTTTSSSTTSTTISPTTTSPFIVPTTIQYGNINSMPTDYSNVWNWPFNTIDFYINSPITQALAAIVFIVVIIWFISWRFNTGRPGVPT